MKKTFLFSLILLAQTNAFANNAVEPFQSAINESSFMVGAFDMSSTIPKRLPLNHAFRRGMMNEHFCWSVNNLPQKRGLYAVELTITAPAATTFINANTGKRESGFSYVSYLNLEAEDGVVQECGQFEGSDPAGTYYLSVKIDGKKYPAQKLILK